MKSELDTKYSIEPSWSKILKRSLQNVTAEKILFKILGSGSSKFVHFIVKLGIVGKHSQRQTLLMLTNFIRNRCTKLVTQKDWNMHLP